MKCIIEAINGPSIYNFLGTAAELRLYATKDFLTSNGQVIPQGNRFLQRSWHLPITCEVQSGNVLYVPSFEIDTTVDGDPATSKWIAQLYDQTGAYIGPFPWAHPTGFAIPATENQTWLTLRAYNRGRTLMNAPVTFPTTDTVVSMIAAAVSQQLLNASETQKGNVAMQDDPIDPNFPIALGPNSPGITRASGLATLVAGEKLVASSAVTATCGIQLTGQDDGAIGPLRVSSKVTGVSFTITSFNEADDGVVFWEIIEP